MQNNTQAMTPMGASGAPATPTSVATPPSAKTPRVLACVLCQHRKIKCDRNTPCSNCIKANVRCTPSAPAPARKRRRPNQDLQERLARCEELLKNYASAASADTPNSSLTGVSDEPPRDAPAFAEPPAWPPAGKVVVEDGSTRIVDSFVFTTLHEELMSMRKLMDSDETEDQSTVASEAATPDDGANDLLLGDCARLSISDTSPEPVHVFRLWQVFLERVNPIIKIIHVPSVQPHVVEAASGTWNVPPNYKPLLFAIFSMGAFALTEVECQQMLGLTRTSALKRFSAGARSALMEVDFMSTYDLVVLQALVLYLNSQQGTRDKHASWVLSGVAVRIAQKMGLHRDGETLNLTPFETEMRRRLWWNLVMHDSGLALMSGLSYSVISLNWTTKVPRNINDAELFPDSNEPIPDRDGPTEMGFSILMATIYRFIIRWHRDHPGFEAAVFGYDIDTAGTQDAGTENKPSGMAEFFPAKFRALVDKFEEELLGLRDKYIDPAAGPSHAVAWGLPKLLLGKLRDTMVPLKERPEYGVEIFTPRDNLFLMGVSSLECSADVFDMFERYGFMWHHRLHFQVEMFTALVGQLVHRPSGSLADRAWNGLGIIFRYHPELYDMSQRKNVTLRSFVMKAWRNRAAAMVEQGKSVPMPQCVYELINTFPEGRVPDSATPASMASSSGGGGGYQDSGAAKLSQVGNRWGRGPGPVDTGFSDVVFGGILDMGPMDWDMFNDSMDEQGNLAGLGYPAVGGNLETNLETPW